VRCIVLIVGACLLSAATAQPAWHQVQSPCQVNAAAAASDSEAWVAGTAGTRLSGFFHWDGSDWTLADTFRNQLVYDICFAGSEAWAVGEQFNFPDGCVYRWDGTHWQQQSDPFDRALQAVAFPDSAHGLAAGAAPVSQHPVMRYADGEWRLDSALTTRRILTGLAFPSASKGYAVGDSGAILRYDDGTWAVVPSPTTRILRRVAMTSAGEGWAVGDGGTILRCADDTWTTVPSPTTHNLRGLAVAGTSGEAWAVGDSGTILHCVQDTWTIDPFVPDPPYVPFYAVAFSSGTHGWAFGYETFGARVALHYSEQTGVKEPRSTPDASRLTPAPTIVRGVLFLPRDPRENGDCPASNSMRCSEGLSHVFAEPVLLDATGRKVLDLYAGPNDVSRLAPGVYFVDTRIDNRESSIIKVVVTR